MCHRSAMCDYCIERATLDFQPLLGKCAVPPLCLKREIRRRPIRIAMGKAARYAALMAGRLEAGVLGCGKDRFVKFGESLPGDCALKGICDDSHLDGDFHVVRHANKGVAPGLGCTGAVSAAALCNGVFEFTAELLCDCERTVHPRVDGVIGVLEGEHNNGLLPVTEPIIEGLARIQ